ncbi:MAG: hypothetical protein HKN43_00275, partial [Rhodothermales bacterium]|nr:hypothetical protein [Rhodothermales bacterium]
MSGSITFTTSCVLSPLTYAWSDGSTDSTRTGLIGGDYSLTVTNASGCVDSFAFSVPGFVEQVITCPSDTTLACGSSIDPDATGSPVIGPDSTAMLNLSFTDSITQDCPLDLIVQRTWFNTLDTLTEEICIQTITVLQTEVIDFGITDSLEVSGICLDSFYNITLPMIQLGCHQSIDTVQTVEVSNDCDAITLSRTWTVNDSCQDTTLMASQIIVLRDVPLFEISNIDIVTDSGDSTGAITFDLTTCQADSISYNWSDGSTDMALTMVPAGMYSVTISNEAGCTDTLSFTIEAAMSAMLTCPPDTTLQCGSSLDPAATGSPTFGLDTSEVLNLSFTDSIMQDCPLDLIVQRTWFNTVDTLTEEICTQTITVLQTEAIDFGISDTLNVTGICLDSFYNLALPMIELGCHQSLDTVQTVEMMNDCDVITLSRTWTVNDSCQDTTLMASQIIILRNVPLFVVSNIDITTDSGDSTGAITFDLLSCQADSISYNWSDGSTDMALTMVPAGMYSVTISNASGCTDTLSFTIEAAMSAMLTCPPDTTVACESPISPEVTGMPESTGYDTVRYEDVIIQDCPGDQIIQRSWIAVVDSTSADTCTQMITISRPGIENLTAPDTVFLVGICAPDVALFLTDTLNLGCNQFIDTTYLVTDTLDCDFGRFTRIWEVMDSCQDTTLVLQQTIVLDNIPTAVITNIDVQGDPGDGSGSIRFDIACVGDSVMYNWSNESMDRDLMGLSAGSYGLTVTTGQGCTESFIFFVPMLDTIILNCPPDTTISCLDGTDPAITGTATGLGFDSLA